MCKMCNLYTLLYNWYLNGTHHCQYVPNSFYVRVKARSIGRSSLFKSIYAMNYISQTPINDVRNSNAQRYRFMFYQNDL